MAITRIYERDIDLLLAEEFKVSPSFSNWFVNQTVQFRGRTTRVVDVEVSKSDALGESDLVVLFETLDTPSRFALFIEDKIHAPLQPEQEARYRMRADAGLRRRLYDTYMIVLCSPEVYRKTHPAVKGFDAFVSYEELAAFLKSNQPNEPRSFYRAELLMNATTKILGAWQKVPDPLTNEFWSRAYQIASKDFVELDMKKPSYTKGQNWVDFRPFGMPTYPRRILVSLKGEQGFVDLTFRGILCRLFFPLIKSLLDEDMTVHQIGRSTSIRLLIPRIKVSDFDETASDKLRVAFTACVRLIRFYRKHQTVLDSAAACALPEAVPPSFSETGGAPEVTADAGPS